MADQEQSQGHHPAEPAGEHHISLTPTELSLRIRLTAAQQQQLHECLAKSGKITFSIRELSVTRLPDTLLQDGVAVD
jgi:hypothetical protein